MTELHRQAQKIFEEALDHPTQERELFIKRACENNHELHDNVKTLLKYISDTNRDDSLNDADIHSPSDLIGTTIGRYTIKSIIGEGGFGVVYLAEQQQPVQRMVAMKIIRTGMDTKSVISRFHAERQALAMMDHPGIASIIDGGTTRSPLDWMELDQDGDGIITKEEWLAALQKIDINNDGEITADEWRAATDLGRPYFVMEHVDGSPINEFCNEHQLSIKERIELFQKLCNAIQHAHNKGIIHRDLKPSNVLAWMGDDGPEATVIDFGISKALNARIGDETFMTAQGNFIGTPEYMSPEQFDPDAADIDTRSDIYALGVLLYELLAGKLPFDRDKMRKANLLEIQRIVQEEEPLKPSTRYDRLRTTQSERMQDIALNRKSLPARLQKHLRGDLDWIAMKCLEKDRERRYETASELLQDLDNYINHRPTFAGPPSTKYRLSKYIRRKAGLLTAVTSVLLVLFIGIFFAGMFALEAYKAQEKSLEHQDLAQSERARSQSITVFLKDMISTVDPANSGDRDDVMLALLQSAADRLENGFTNSPLIEAELKSTLGKTYISVGLFEEAKPHLVRTLDIYLKHLGKDDIKTVSATQDLGNLLRKEGHYEEALSHHASVLNYRRKALGSEHPKTLESIGSMGVVLMNMGDFQGAETYLSEDMNTSRKILGEQNPNSLSAASNYGALLFKTGRINQAKEIWSTTLELRKSVLGPDDPSTIDSMSNLGLLLAEQSQFFESESLLKEVLLKRVQILGEDHPSTLFSRSALGMLLLKMHEQRFDDGRNLLHSSKQLIESSLNSRRFVLGNTHPSTLVSILNMASWHEHNGELDNAERLYSEALDLQMESSSDNHLGIMETTSKLAKISKLRGMHSAEAEYLERLYEANKLTTGISSTQLLQSLENLIEAMHKSESWPRLIQIYEENESILLNTFDAENNDVLLRIRRLYENANEEIRKREILHGQTD